MKVRVTRRQVLRYAVVAGVGVATATLVSCAPTQESPRPTAAPAPPTQPPAVVLPQATSTTPPQPAATVQAAVTPTARPAVAASPTPAPAVKRGGILKTSSVINYPSMDPHLNGTIGQTGYGMLFDPLLGFKYRMDPPRWEVTPALATSWEIPDPLTVILRLRQGVKFTDGSDWNAEVARWNLLRIRDHPKSFFKTVVDVIEDVGTTDSHTVKLKLKRPSAAIFANLTEAAGSIYMISKAAHDKLGDEGIATSPSGTGPMVLERWVRDNVVELKRKNDYWAKGTDGKPLPYLDGYHDYYRPDPTVAIAELRAGTVDIVQEPDPKDRAALQARPEIAVLEHPSAGYGYFGYGLNPKTKLFQDRRVRLAFAHAIEREAMVKTLSFGYGKPHYVRRWAPGVLGYEEGAYPKYDFSPDKVKQYLTEAGYPEGIDVTMAVINRALDMRQAELVKAVWDKAGIRT
ncbi:MAG: ABC transporter substrate-binding protein, partial [Chloroflexi bacterium]|nr:ABC transporter substrate-binding protein [Chloroflexota bacterium]